MLLQGGAVLSSRVYTRDTLSKRKKTGEIPVAWRWPFSFSSVNKKEGPYDLFLLLPSPQNIVG